jgi:hypothetical protein
MKIETETIDLETARKYLEKNIDFSYESDVKTNRPVTWTRVVRYAKDMLRGRWILTPQAIGFTKSGKLVDGQKRLMALILGATEGVNGYAANPNLTFETLVVYGLDDEVFEVVDTGETRTSAQILAMSGIRNGMPLAAASRLVHSFYNVPDVGRWPSQLTNHDILELVTTHDLGKYYSTVANLGKIGLIKSVAVAGTLICTEAMPEGLDGKTVEKFNVALRDGVDEDGLSLKKDDPRYALREYLINSLQGPRMRKSREPVVQLMNYIKCWNDYLYDRRRSICSWRISEGVIRPRTS